MEKREDKALHYFAQEKLNCSESILLSFLKEEDLQMVRLATPFGGGVGRSRDLCGILTGGVMAIGYFLGRIDGEEQDAKCKAYDAAKEYYLWFEENHKTKCKEILPGEFKDHKEICYALLKDAVVYLEALLKR